MTTKRPDRQQILDMMAGFMPSCVLGAAVELDIFTAIGDESPSADQLADRLSMDLRATTIMLDAVVALGLLDKSDGRYSVPDDLRPMLTEGNPETILPMLRHRMNMVRTWSQLAWVTKAGVPAPRQSSIRGAAADRAAFVAAMHTVSQHIADELVAKIQPGPLEHLLDVGGASGTWTLAFLRAVPGARAIIFDLPDAISQAQDRIAETGLADRITLAPGDFYQDDLPAGADFAWVSAIIHQHSRAHSRELFVKVYSALVPGGRIAIRDVVMDPSRISPVVGALFAVNMLVATETGGTFTFEEIAEDLRVAGFVEPELRIKEDGMSSVVMAAKP